MEMPAFSPGDVFVPWEIGDFIATGEVFFREICSTPTSGCGPPWTCLGPYCSYPAIYSSLVTCSTPTSGSGSPKKTLAPVVLAPGDELFPGDMLIKAEGLYFPGDMLSPAAASALPIIFDEFTFGTGLR